MATVQIWNGSTWMDFYTLPNATSSTLGGVKIGNNITVSNGTISLTKSNVTSALGYTPLSLSGGTMTGTVTLPENKMAIKFRTNNSYETGFVYGTAGNEAITLAMKNPVTAFQIVYGTTPSAFTSSTWQNVTPLFQTKDNKVIINRKITQTSDTTNLKLLDVNGDMAATTIYEGGTALSSKYAAASHNHDSSYLGKTATAADSSKLNGQSASYYALANHTHTSLKSNTDNRSTNTTPNNYNGVFNIAGLKTNSNIGLNANTYGDYSCLIGVRGWSDNSGGNAHEIALTGNGYLMHRHGATTSWNDWKRIAYTSDIPGIATQSAAGLMSSTDKTKLDGVATGATKVTTDTVSGWGYTKNTGTVTQVKVGTTAYNPSSGVVSLPAYPVIPTSLKNPNSITIKAGNDTVSSYDGSAAKTFTFAASTTAGAFTVSDGNTTKTIQLAGKFTDNNSWRPVVDNLTSTATDQSLSANQGKVLKGLVDGKAASSHTHSQYLTSHLYRPIQVDGVSTLSNTSDTALNLKAGNNISLSKNGGTVTINSTASGGGGMTCYQIFEGAGDKSGQYHQYGSWSTKIDISSQGYKMLLFEVDVNDVNFYLSVPTNYIISETRYFYLAAGNSNNGAMGIVEVMANNTNFSASVSNGNIIVWNVNIYAYK